MTLGDGLQHVGGEREHGIAQQLGAGIHVAQFDDEVRDGGFRRSRRQDGHHARIEARNEVDQVGLRDHGRPRKHQARDVGPIGRQLRDQRQGSVAHGADGLRQRQADARRSVARDHHQSSFERAAYVGGHLDRQRTTERARMGDAMVERRVGSPSEEGFQLRPLGHGHLLRNTCMEGRQTW